MERLVPPVLRAENSFPLEFLAGILEGEILGPSARTHDFCRPISIQPHISTR